MLLCREHCRYPKIEKQSKLPPLSNPPTPPPLAIRKWDKRPGADSSIYNEAEHIQDGNTIPTEVQTKLKTPLHSGNRYLASDGVSINESPSEWSFHRHLCEQAHLLQKHKKYCCKSLETQPRPKETCPHWNKKKVSQVNMLQPSKERLFWKKTTKQEIFFLAKHVLFDR